jgi:SAM-dependent methyltransferase
MDLRPWRVAFGASLLSGVAQIALVRELSAAQAVSSLALALRLVVAVVLIAFGVGAALVPFAARTDERRAFGAIGFAIAAFFLVLLVALLRWLEPGLGADVMAPTRLLLLGCALSPPFIGFGFVIAALTARLQRDAPQRLGAFVAATLIGTMLALVVAHHWGRLVGVNSLLLATALATPFVLRDRGSWALAIALVVALTPAEQWLEARRDARPGWVAPVEGARARRVYSGWSPYQKIDLYTFDDDVLLGVHNGFWQWWVSSHLDHRHAFPGYGLLYDARWVEGRDVLVIGSGAGMGLLHLERAHPRSLTAVEIDPLVVDLARGRFAAYSDHVYDRVTTHVAEGRTFLDATDRQFDVIVFEGASLTTAHPRVQVNAESYLYTREGIAKTLDRLRPGGVALVLFVGPERALARLARAVEAENAAFAALRLSYGSTLWTHLEVLAFGRDRARLEAIADAVVAGAGPEHATRHPIATADVTPISDDRPFLYRGDGGELAPIRWLVGLGLAGVAAAIAWPGMRRVRAYYVLIGIAYVFVQYGIFARVRSWLGDPVTTSYVTLLLLLAGMALGSTRTETFAVLGRGRRMAVIATGVLVGAALLFGLPADWGLRPSALRVAYLAAATLPLGAVLGLFFPLGLRGRPAGAVPVAFLFDAAGTALGFLAFHLAALSGGITATLAIGAGLYVLAAWIRE